MKDKISNKEEAANSIKGAAIGWQHPDLDAIRNNLHDVKHWIEQAEQNLNSTPNKAHFKRSIRFAKRYLAACR